MLNFSIISLTKLQKNTPDERFHACFPSRPQANKRDTNTSTNTLADRHSHTAPQAAQTFYWPGLKAGGMWWAVVCNGNNKGDRSGCASVCIWSLSVKQLKKPKLKPKPELKLEPDAEQTVWTTAKTRQKNLWNSSLKAIAASIQMEFNSIALLTLDFFLYNNCILCGAASAQEPWLNDW